LLSELNFLLTQNEIRNCNFGFMCSSVLMMAV